MGKKKFIDKKKSATFQLFARDSSDINYEEGPASDRVFVRVDDNPYSVDNFSNDPAEDPNSIFADAPDDEDEDEYEDTRTQTHFPYASSGSSSVLPDSVRREILELGFPDDGYNYLTHLREIKNTGGGSAYYENSKAKLDQLPNDIKAYDASRVHISELNDSSVEKSVYSAALNTYGARIQKVIDPEVAALLDLSDDDMSRFGSDIEELEEDFVINASLGEVPSNMEPDKKQFLLLEEHQKKEVNETYGFVHNKSISRFLSDDKRESIAKEGTVFNEPPRIRRPLDEQFDMLELQEYGSESEHENGDELFEENEYRKEPLAEKLNHALKDHVKNDLQADEKYKAPSDLLHNQDEGANILIDKVRKYGEKYEKEDENRDEDVVIVEESSDESEIWDCETIVTTYSNLDNHPGKIDAPDTRRRKQLLAQAAFGSSNPQSQIITLKGREKLPVDFLPRKPGTEKSKEDSKLKTEPIKRKQHGQESKEEKKERKVVVKEERREARRIKKETKELYKSEGYQAQKVAAFSGPSSIHLM
jgi:protein LTV1